MKDWWRQYGPQSIAVGTIVLAMLATAMGSTWTVSNVIGGLRTELKDDIADLELRMESRFGSVETRISVVEAKLDILIEGLNIEVSPESVGKMDGGSHSTAAVTGGKDGDGDLQRKQKAEKLPT